MASCGRTTSGGANLRRCVSSGVGLERNMKRKKKMLLVSNKPNMGTPFQQLTLGSLIKVEFRDNLRSCINGPPFPFFSGQSAPAAHVLGHSLWLLWYVGLEVCISRRSLCISHNTNIAFKTLLVFSFCLRCRIFSSRLLLHRAVTCPHYF